MPRVLFPNIPMRMVLQPRNKLAQNLRGSGSSKSAAAVSTDPRREGAWSKVVIHTKPSTSKFEIKQYLSKVYNLDVKKVRLRPRPANLDPANIRHAASTAPMPCRTAAGLFAECHVVPLTPAGRHMLAGQHDELQRPDRLPHVSERQSDVTTHAIPTTT